MKKVYNLGPGYQMSPNETKPVIGVSLNVRLKPISSATETRSKNEISLEASLDMKISKKRITKVLISLCMCPGLSAPLLLAHPEDRFFLASEPT